MGDRLKTAAVIGENMKILVTGANGYLGQGIINELLKSGNEVIAADFKTDHVNAAAKRVNCDLFSVEDPYSYFDQPDVLLHLAWRDGFVHNSIHHLEDLSKHYQFLEKMVKAGISQIAVMGSMHEVGFFEGSINENTPCHPMSLYGIAKNALREGLEQLTNGTATKWQWLRGYYIVGNAQYGSSIFSKITSAVKEGKTSFPFTSGKNQYDFLDYEVFCRQIAAAVQQEETLGIIEICSGYPEMLSTRVERFIAENGYTIKLDYGAFPDRPYDSAAVWGNSAKISCIMKNYKY
jgi:nucleoside-diphosphate-sugar epimerase